MGWEHAMFLVLFGVVIAVMNKRALEALICLYSAGSVTQASLAHAPT
jgi:hypothetical protein